MTASILAILAVCMRAGPATRRRSWIEPSIGPALDGSGAVIAFSSRHPRDASDEGDDYDLFVRQPAK